MEIKNKICICQFSTVGENAIGKKLQNTNPVVIGWSEMEDNQKSSAVKIRHLWGCPAKENE